MARPAKVSVVDNQRLDAGAWIKGALDLLAERGIDGVRIEPLAKVLGVTKGSFYWHFKDRDALFESMLSQWRRKATLQIIERIENSQEPPRTRLRQLLRIPFKGVRADRAADIELSIRLWGRRDQRAHAALEEVDQLRLRYLAQLLEQCGVAPSECHPRALIAYSLMRVGSTLGANDEAVLDQCEAVIAGR